MTRIFTSDYREKNTGYPDPFPVNRLTRVDRPTTLIRDEEVSRVDERDGGFQRADREEYGKRARVGYRRFITKHPLSSALWDMSLSLSRSVDGTPGLQKASLTDDSVAMARHIKETAYFLRADMVGICELPQYAVFTHSLWDGKPIECNHKYAVAILVDQDWKTASAFNGHDWISNSMSFLSYSTSGFIACILANYIRKLGYPARAHHAMNYQVLVPPILLWAGLGEMSRIGDVVLNPFLGPRFKAAVVTTDLPLSIDKPIDFGLQDFCKKCAKCAEHCPASAISDGNKVMHSGYEKWEMDVKKCTSFRVTNPQGAGCGTCIKVCPWNKPNTPFHKSINWMLRKFPLFRRPAVLLDDLCGYGKPKPELKWWLDLEEVDDVLTDRTS